MEEIWDCLESRADKLMEEQRRMLRETPVYRYPASYAQEHGEPGFPCGRWVRIICLFQQT